MQRRVSLPGADALFGGEDSARREPTKSKHDEKITVYLSSEDLIAIEQARLQLKADYGVRVDRGRLVREAVAVCLEEFDELGAEAQIVERLRR